MRKATSIAQQLVGPPVSGGIGTNDEQAVTGPSWLLVAQLRIRVEVALILGAWAPTVTTPVPGKPDCAAATPPTVDPDATKVMPAVLLASEETLLSVTYNVVMVPFKVIDAAPPIVAVTIPPTLELDAMELKAQVAEDDTVLQPT